MHEKNLQETKVQMSGDVWLWLCLGPDHFLSEPRWYSQRRKEKHGGPTRINYKFKIQSRETNFRSDPMKDSVIECEPHI